MTISNSLEAEYKISRKMQRNYLVQCCIYDNLLQSISAENVLINIAKYRNDNFVVITSLTELMPSFDKIKDLTHNFHPYGKITIYDILHELLPPSYKISVVER